MRYVAAYTLVATASFGLSLYDPGPELTDTIAAFGSHLGGCIGAACLWVHERTMRTMAETKALHECMSRNA